MALYRRARSSRLLVVSLVVVSLLTITVDYRGGQSGPLERVGEAALTVLAPLQSAVSKVFRPIGAFFSGLVHVASLQKENDRLRLELQKARTDSTTTAALRRQAEQMSKVLKLQHSLGLEDVVAATVIGQSLSNFEWTVTLDEGSSSGVKLDFAVISGDGLVGHVVRVSPNACVVQLIIDPHSGVAARLAASGETGLVKGETDRRDLTMDLVSPDTKVRLSEPVLTAGYAGSLYPANIPIGFVSHVYSGSGSLTETLNVRPAVDFSSLEIVEVVMPR
jgi:rod shape-determining protein MreC